MELTNEHLIKYKDLGFRETQGWVYEKLFEILQFIDNLPINKKGGICEIGVHHGKFFIMLNQLVDPGYRSYAIDIFDDQHLNIDRSGNGCLEIFLQHVQSYDDRHRGNNTVCLTGDSADPALRIVETIGAGSMKFVSVDGSHTTEHALNDIQLASQIMRNEGVVIVDDILHPYGLGPLEATVKFLEGKPTLMPFAMGCNKLFMAKSTFRQCYFDHFSNSELSCGIIKFFGHDIVTFGQMEPLP